MPESSEVSWSRSQSRGVDKEEFELVWNGKVWVWNNEIVHRPNNKNWLGWVEFLHYVYHITILLLQFYYNDSKKYYSIRVFVFQKETWSGEKWNEVISMAAAATDSDGLWLLVVMGFYIIRSPIHTCQSRIPLFTIINSNSWLAKALKWFDGLHSADCHY